MGMKVPCVIHGMVAALLFGNAGAAPAAAGVDAASALQRQGDAFAAALLRADFPAVAAATCSPVLARVGGAVALARQIEVSFRIMQQQGRELLRMQFGHAGTIVDAGATRFALVPYRSIVRVRDGRLAIDSWYLGVQNKDADDWCFIDTAALTPAILHDLFPGAPPALKLPPPGEAVVERDAPD